MEENTPSEGVATLAAIVRAPGFARGLVAGGLIVGVILTLISIATGPREQDHALSESSAQTLDTISSILKSLEKLTADLGNKASEDESGTEHARRAAQRAEELRDSNPAVAGILYLNAFNANPQNVEPLLAYVDLMTETEGTDEVISQVVGMVDVALYRMAPEDVERMVDLKSTLEARLSGAGGSIDTATAETDLNQTLDSLLASDNSVVVADKATLEKYIQDADYFLQQIDQDPVPIENLARVPELQEKLEVLQRCQHALQLAESAETFAGRAESFVQGNNTRLAMLLLNSAENAAVQSASLCDPSMPGEVLKRATDLLARLDTLTGSISENQSRAALAKLEEVARKRVDIVNGQSNLQSKSKALENVLREIQPLFGEITASAPQAKALEIVGAVQDSLAETRREQGNAYNRWALERCQKAASGIREEWTKTSNDARRVFGESELALIDPVHLSPEVSRIYNQTLEKLMSEMGSEDAAEHERKLTESQKKRLEEF